MHTREQIEQAILEVAAGVDVARAIQPMTESAVLEVICPACSSQIPMGLPSCPACTTQLEWPDSGDFSVADAINKLLGEKVMVKAKHPGILELPPGGFMTAKVGYFVGLAKKKGKAAIQRALLNLERWNKKKNPKVAAHAREAIDALKAAA